MISAAGLLMVFMITTTVTGTSTPPLEGNRLIKKQDVHHGDNISGIRILTSSVRQIVYQESSNNDYQVRSIIDIIDEGGKMDRPAFGDSPRGILPRNFSLRQNYPNPFNPHTVIQYEIPAQKKGNVTIPVRLNIYDIRGRLVRTLVDTEREPGIYRVQWDGKNERGDRVGSGVFFFTIRTCDYSNTRKMVLIE